MSQYEVERYLDGLISYAERVLNNEHGLAIDETAITLATRLLEMSEDAKHAVRKAEAVHTGLHAAVRRLPYKRSD